MAELIVSLIYYVIMQCHSHTQRSYRYWQHGNINPLFLIKLRNLDINNLKLICNNRVNWIEPADLECCYTGSSGSALHPEHRCLEIRKIQFLRTAFPCIIQSCLMRNYVIGWYSLKNINIIYWMHTPMQSYSMGNPYKVCFCTPRTKQQLQLIDIQNAHPA